MKMIGEKLKVNKMEDWYAITAEQIAESGG